MFTLLVGCTCTLATQISSIEPQASEKIQKNIFILNNKGKPIVASNRVFKISKN